MLQSDFGTLHLPVRAEEIAYEMTWLDYDANRILLLIALILMLFSLAEMYKLFPAINACLIRARGNLEVEHSLSTARSRDMCARIYALPFLLVIDRYNFYEAAFIPPMGDALKRFLMLVLVLLAYLLLRKIIFLLVDHFVPPRMDGEARKALSKSIYNYFLYYVIVMLVSLAVMYIFSATDDSIRTVLGTEMLIMMSVALFRESQILSQSCSGLGTFLYLCGLEILPAVILVLSGILM